MYVDIEGLQCCAIDEIGGISNCARATDVIEDVCKNWFEDCERDNDEGNAAFYLFTDTEESNAGMNLAKYIVAEKLGTVVSTQYRVNPNSGNKVKCWIWSVNKVALKKWAKHNDCYTEIDNYY